MCGIVFLLLVVVDHQAGVSTRLRRNVKLPGEDVDLDFDSLEAPQDAKALLRALLKSTGSGRHTLTVSAALSRRDHTTHLDFWSEGGRIAAEETQVFDLLATLALVTTGCTGGAIMRTEDADGASVHAWGLRERAVLPFDRARCRIAYCTDPLTGESIPSEPGVTYADAPNLTV